MTTAAFDTHAAVKQLRAAGVNDAQAETLVDIMSRALGDPVTKADLEPLATKEFVRAAISGVDGEIAAVHTKIVAVHAEMQSQIAGVRTEVADVRTEIAQVEARLFRHLWVMAAGIVGATFTLLKLFP